MVLRRIPVAGGSAESLAWMHSASALVADGSELYWSQHPPQGGQQIRRGSIAGGPSTVLYDSEFGFAIDGLWVDADNIYFSVWEAACQRQIRRIPKAGGSATMVVAGLPEYSAPVVAVGGGKLFWATGLNLKTIRSLDL
jgi:hypothetical protein